MTLNDALAVVALALLTLGAGLIYTPLAFIVSGALLLIYAVMASRTERVEP
jgi:hypothetical protein